MKRFQVKTGLIFASWALMLVFGCHQKKPPIPPQEQPPTVATVDQQPSPELKPPTPEQQTTTPAQPELPQATDKPPDKPAPKHPKPHTVKKPATATEPDKTPVEVAKSTPPEPPRIVIQEGGSNAQSGQTGTGAPGDDNQATKQLLDSTDDNIRNIEKRQLSLSANERSTLAQIKDYVTQSKQAIKDGDLVRAHNLAVKAHLLSDDLAKPK